MPGLWLSAVMMRTGVGPAAWLATRIGTTLAWYALVGPVIHASAQGARVTTGGIVGATVAATAAVCLGVALGLLRRPADPWLRLLVACRRRRCLCPDRDLGCRCGCGPTA